MADSIISSIKVEGLFGLYSYDLPKEGAFSTATIFYGDNGVGKSTILRMVFHLLSTSNINGHRTALTEINFKSFKVNLSNGAVVSARKLFDEYPYILTLDIEHDGKTIAWWEHVLGSEREKYNRNIITTDYKLITTGSGARRVPIRKKTFISAEYFNDDIPSGNETFLKELEKLVPTMFILNADRKLDSDAVADPNDEVELRKRMYFHEPDNISDLVNRSREIALSQAMSSASKWFSQQAVRATNEGSTNVHSVYAGVINQLQANTYTSDSKTSKEDRIKLLNDVISVGVRTSELAEYELATALDVKSFKSALETNSAQSDLAIDLLKPYVESLLSKLNTLSPIYNTIDNFVRTVNSFLNDKSISFRTSEGFVILNRNNSPLESSQLSSGEQQLLLLFCYVVTGRDRPSVFIIDEPEISLNIKWQRKLVQSLLDVTGDSKVQFIFASHSMELLSQHEDLVVQLDN